MQSEDNLDEALLAARNNVSSGWTTIYNTLAPAVMGYLRAQGAAEPEDLTAEVFVQAVKSIQRFTGDAARFRSWIFCIAHNKLVDEARYRSRRPVQPIADAGSDRVCSTDVENDVLASLANERVRRLISGLTPDQKSVLFLRILAGLTIDEAARALGKNVTAVKALQRRGLGSLRRELSSEPVSV